MIGVWYTLILIIYLAMNDNIEICSWILVGLSYVLMIITFPISLCLCIRVSFS
jgi:hypothetical protein